MLGSQGPGIIAQRRWKVHKSEMKWMNQGSIFRIKHGSCTYELKEVGAAFTELMKY